MDRVSRRYSMALLEIAGTHNSINTFGQQLTEVVKIIQSNIIINNILSNPENPFEAKTGIIDSIFGGSIHKDVMNLIKLLIEKKRIGLLQGILEEYKAEAQKITSTLDVTAISAFPLLSDEIEGIKQKMKQQYKVSEINLITQIDESLLGGFKLIIGNEVIDKSVKGMMDTLSSEVKKI